MDKEGNIDIEKNASQIEILAMDEAVVPSINAVRACYEERKIIFVLIFQVFFTEIFIKLDEILVAGKFPEPCEMAYQYLKCAYEKNKEYFAFP